MSIVQALHRQYLVAQKNNLQFNMLQNSMAQRSLLNSNYSPSFSGLISDGLELSNLQDSVQYQAINAELNAIQNSKIDYLA